MEESLVQVLLQGGMGSIIVVAWFFFNKANMNAFSSILAAQTRRDDINIELLKQMIDAQEKRAATQLETLQDIVEQMTEMRHIVGNPHRVTAEV